MSKDKYWEQGADKIEEAYSTVLKLVGTFPEPRKTKVKSMLEDLGEQFMTAPASTNRTHHNAFPGGLLLHSISVVKHAHAIANAVAPNRWAASRITFCALFHDLGKAGTPGNPYYIQVEDEWKFRRGHYYEVNKDEWMPSAERGLFILQQAGIVLDHEEYMAIRLNDGMGPAENKPYSFREPDLSLIIHWADHWAMRQEKEAAKAFL